MIFSVTLPEAEEELVTAPVVAKAEMGKGAELKKHEKQNKK